MSMTSRLLEDPDCILFSRNAATQQQSQPGCTLSVTCGKQVPSCGRDLLHDIEVGAGGPTARFPGVTEGTRLAVSIAFGPRNLSNGQEHPVSHILFRFSRGCPTTIPTLKWSRW
jgi:hypothetical protein